MNSITLATDRARLYDTDTRDTLRYGAPLVSALLLAEGVAHLPEEVPGFTLATLVAAVLVAPLGWLAQRDLHLPLPVRFWPLWITAVCMAMLVFHMQPFSASATAYLNVAFVFGCGALIIEPRVFAVSAAAFAAVLVYWVLARELAAETSVFALACIPLALAVYWARRRSLLIGERQRELERELLRQRDEVDMVRRVLGMNRGLTHHFNNVFSGIVGGTSLALEQLEEGHQAREAVAVALASGEHGSEIIERLGLSGRSVREPVTSLSVRELLTAPDVQGLIPRHCRFDIVTTPDLPPVRGQRERIRQALRELIANAVEAIGDQPGAIRVEIGPGEREDHVEILVIDSGVGMSDAELLRCFEPFYTTRDPTRRGLGLAYVMGVVERHEGTIRIDSQPGRGTRVRLSLPAAEG